MKKIFLFITLFVFLFSLTKINAEPPNINYKDNICVLVNVWEIKFSSGLSFYEVKIKKIFIKDDGEKFEKDYDFYFLDVSPNSPVIVFCKFDNTVKLFNEDNQANSVDEKKITISVEIGEKSQFGFSDILIVGFEGDKSDKEILKKKEMKFVGSFIFEKGSINFPNIK